MQPGSTGFLLPYNDGLQTLLNSRAPLKTSHSGPWFSPHLHQLKAKGRQLERLSSKTGLTVHKQMHHAHILQRHPAAVTPLLKKPDLDPNIFNNLRPISNLPFLSKIMENAVASQIQAHLSNNNLYEQFQSGFRPVTAQKQPSLKLQMTS